MDALTVYTSSGTKCRIGSSNDGGYVIEAGHTYDILISCGIANDITFEEHFLTLNNVACLAYDGTIAALPPSTNTSIQRITFNKKNIGVMNSDTITNLHVEIEPYHNIFLKMDIETFEYRWLHTMSYEQLMKYKQIVIEFHFPFTDYPFHHLDVNIPVREKMYVFEMLKKTHVLIHFHANNCCGTTEYNGTIVPNVFECTFIRKDMHVDSGKNTDPIPSALDSPCVNHTPDIALAHPPFCWTRS